MVDKPKSSPIIGIADWLAKESRLEDAKTVLASVKKSKKSTEEDIKAAEKLSNELKLKNREAIAKAVKKHVVLVPTKSVKPNKDIEEKMVIKVEDYNRIKNDVDERGIQVPLVINDKNEVVCGITRWKVCQELGIEEVPCFKGSWDLYQDMMDYAIKDNVMRRQLTNDERVGLTTSLLRDKEIMPVGRPPIQGTLKEQAAITKKVNKAIAKGKPKPPAREVDKLIEKDYKWVVGKNHQTDDTFAIEVGKEVSKQLELLKTDRAEIKVYVKYEVKL